MNAKKLRRLFRQQFGTEPEKVQYETRAIVHTDKEGKTVDTNLRVIVSQSGKNQFRQFKKLHTVQ